MSLEKQLEGEKLAINQVKEKQNKLQTSTELEALKTNFNDCQERANMFSKTQAELESWIDQYERLYKKHVMLENELAEAKAKGKAIGVFKIDLDKMTNEINLLEEKLDKKKSKAKHLEEKNELLEHHNQMIDTNNNQLNMNNMFLLEKIRNMNN
ncbi:hypothetical protein Peur_049096 [Populus x canadensis]|jgi:predicted RNase H-like nuclease (RuvC/YqgF family)